MSGWYKKGPTWPPRLSPQLRKGWRFAESWITSPRPERWPSALRGCSRASAGSPCRGSVCCLQNGVQGEQASRAGCGVAAGLGGTEVQPSREGSWGFPGFSPQCPRRGWRDSGRSAGSLGTRGLEAQPGKAREWSRGFSRGARPGAPEGSGLPIGQRRRPGGRRAPPRPVQGLWGREHVRGAAGRAAQGARAAPAGKGGKEERGVREGDGEARRMLKMALGPGGGEGAGAAAAAMTAASGRAGLLARDRPCTLFLLSGLSSRR